MDSPLRSHPDLIAEAERRAGLLLEAVRAHHGLMSDHTEGAVCEAHLDLLLNDPDICARLLAARVGIVVGATAPGWRRVRLALPNGSESWAWVLLGAPGEQFFFMDGNAPGISALTDPLPALHAALAATDPRKA